MNNLVPLSDKLEDHEKNNGQSNKEEDITREEGKEQERVQDTDRNKAEDSEEEVNGDDFSDYSH